MFLLRDESKVSHGSMLSLVFQSFRSSKSSRVPFGINVRSVRGYQCDDSPLSRMHNFIQFFSLQTLIERREKYCSHGSCTEHFYSLSYPFSNFRFFFLNIPIYNILLENYRLFNCRYLKIGMLFAKPLTFSLMTYVILFVPYTENLFVLSEQCTR